MSNGTLLLGWRKRWNRSLLRFIGRRVRAPVDIEDLAQETYLRLLRARDLSKVRHPQAYLLRVASHVISEWRTRQPPRDMLEVMDENVLESATPLEFVLETEVCQESLDRVLAEMSPVTRAVVLLRCRESRSCSDIARELELTDRQVRRHLTRAYERLRGVIAG
jgi:RNA polymerase sigma-70 factor (ECF subfamily)